TRGTSVESFRIWATTAAQMRTASDFAHFCCRYWQQRQMWDHMVKRHKTPFSMQYSHCGNVSILTQAQRDMYLLPIGGWERE
ncbi:hypothetical protein DXG03_005359, partial [Asterophora parasitica]